MTTQRAEPYRVNWPGLESKVGDNFGAFQMSGDDGKQMRIICAPTDELWQHVSVSLARRCPTWNELCKVKNLFWEDDEVMNMFDDRKYNWFKCPDCLNTRLDKVSREEGPLK